MPPDIQCGEMKKTSCAIVETNLFSAINEGFLSVGVIGIINWYTLLNRINVTFFQCWMTVVLLKTTKILILWYWNGR